MYYPWLHVHCMPVPVRLREGEGGLCGQPPKEPKTLVTARATVRLLHPLSADYHLQ